ncbi:MAG: sigma 54-interacting transcriptional regulator [Planctomycetales bacterium]|nr:sigma 54-interacting transcriptional regulator [Planctomycetales bacterium]
MRLRVAIADDEADMRDYLERLLPRMGHQVVAVAENGRELVELCQLEPPDLVITDLRMPELDGLSAIAQIRELGPMPVIAISAHIGEREFIERFADERSLFLPKPCKSADLERAILELCSDKFASAGEQATIEAPADAAERSERDNVAPTEADAAESEVPTRMSGRPLQLLVVEDDSEFRKDVAGFLGKLGHEVHEAGDAETALAHVGRSAFDVAIIDLRLPGMSGMDLLEKLRHSNEDCQVVILTGAGSVETAVQAMKLGAFDFLTKPVKLRQLSETVDRAWRHASVLHENRQLRAALRRHERPSEMIGESPKMETVYRLIERAGPTDKPVLILGESGTGKELVANALHAASNLSQKPLVVVNCAALPETLLESELFGHEKGAFTGAVAAKPGLFEVADGGTLFIDEIGELAGGLQAKLLRVLEDGSMRRIGSVKQRRVNVRLIAATNRDLGKEVEAGKFREDLYYRINLLTITLPPLRERTGDLPKLVRFFADDWQVSEVLMATLQSYPWPGNVRQLRNAIERMKILADSEVLNADDLPPEVLAFSAEVAGRPHTAEEDLESLTRQHVLDTYERCGKNKARTAKALGIGRRSLYRLLEKYGLHTAEHLDDH